MAHHRPTKTNPKPKFCLRGAQRGQSESEQARLRRSVAGRRFKTGAESDHAHSTAQPTGWEAEESMSSYGNFMGGALKLKSDGPSSSAPELASADERKAKKDKKHKKHKKSKKGKEKKEKKVKKDKSKKRQRRDEGRDSGNDSDDSHSRSGKKARHDGKEATASAAAASDSGEEGLEGLTPSQRKFELSRRKREKERIDKMLSKTHRQKIDEFNDKLSKLTEHHDMPKISGAGNG